jgi:SRSO17 transposase
MAVQPQPELGPTRPAHAGGRHADLAAVDPRRELEALHQRIGRHVARPEPRRRALTYMHGLLAPVQRKNGWTLAEYGHETIPDGMQPLLGSARWDADRVREDLRDYVVERLGSAQAVLAVCESAFAKRGPQSAGVQRQYSRTAGRVENCQLGVFLAYLGRERVTFLDRELYLPRSWTADAARRRRAAVPGRIPYANRSELAQVMLARALDARVPCRWVTVTEPCGSDPMLRAWLEQRHVPYVLEVPASERLWTTADHSVAQVQAGTLATRVPPDRCYHAGGRAPHASAWQRLSLRRASGAGMTAWLLLRRRAGDPEVLSYHLCYGPANTPLPELVRVALARRSVDLALEGARRRVGLDHYEVRRYDAWYRHMTLALMAYATLVATVAPQ